jgi:hypothetical protein
MTSAAPDRGGRLLVARVLLGVLAATGFVIGGWAEVAPASFYRSFPGFGRHWLPPLGPYNEHLVTDFGALNLALAAATLIAAVTLTRSATAAACAAWIVYAVPHVAFHATHGERFAAGDDVAVLASLIASAVASAAAFWLVMTAAGNYSRPSLRQSTV